MKVASVPVRVLMAGMICSPNSLLNEIRVLWSEPVSCSGDLGYAN